MIPARSEASSLGTAILFAGMAAAPLFGVAVTALGGYRCPGDRSPHVLARVARTSRPMTNQ